MEVDKVSVANRRYTKVTYTPGAETLDIPAPPPFQESYDEPDWKRDQRKVVGAFVGPGSGSMYNGLREKTRDRLGLSGTAADVDGEAAA